MKEDQRQLFNARQISEDRLFSMLERSKEMWSKDFGAYTVTEILDEDKAKRLLISPIAGIAACIEVSHECK